jgi:hypothetical protein
VQIGDTTAVLAKVFGVSGLVVASLHDIVTHSAERLLVRYLCCNLKPVVLPTAFWSSPFPSSH